MFIYYLIAPGSRSLTSEEARGVLRRRANGNHLQLKDPHISGSEAVKSSIFAVYCFVYLLVVCTYIMFSHLILHLIVNQLTVFTRESSLLSVRLTHCNSVRLSVCLSVRPSVTRVDQSKTVQARITKFSPSAARKTLFSGTVKLFHKFEGAHPKRGC